MPIPTSIYYFPRRLHVFWTALRVYLILKVTQRCNNLLKRTEEQVEQAWKRSNTRAAKLILRTSAYRGGLWIK